MLLILVDAVVLLVLLSIFDKPSSYLWTFLVTFAITGIAFGMTVKYGQAWGPLPTLGAAVGIGLLIVKFAFDLPIIRALMIMVPFFLYRVTAEFLILNALTN